MIKSYHILLLAITLLVMPTAIAQAQEPIQVKGVVKDASDGTTIIGAVIYLKGNMNVSAVSELDGSYSIKVPSDGTLVYSMMGYDDGEEQVSNRAVIDVELNIAATLLNSTVVSALGIDRQAKSLTYSTQSVKNDELTRARDVNMINALAGKAAGVTITHTTAGLGGAAKVSIRGFRSVTGNNQPLYVINGMPIKNDIGAQANSLLIGSHDGGDGISNLNPDDIESISILKGASASALYGTEAANGVIMITTKKASAGRTSVSLNSSTTFDQVAYLPEFQSRYGESEGYYSWGDKITGSFNKRQQVMDFFQTGVAAMNTVSVSTGNDVNQTYLSYGNTTSRGIYANSKFGKNNITLRNITKLWNVLTIDASVQLLNQSVNNRPRPGGSYSNPLSGLYHSPIGRDISAYESEYEIYEPTRNMMVQNWYKPIQPFEENPWWLINRNLRSHNRNRGIASLTMKWTVTPWFNIQARGNLDFNSDREEVKFYASTSTSTAGSTNGLYEYGQSTGSMLYTDVLANFNKRWGSFGLTASIGGSFVDNRSNSLYASSYSGNGLSFANIFTISNIVNQNFSQGSYRSQKAGLFATANLSFKEYLYMDITARNDWSSALAYTDSFKKGFFYPSVGLTFLLNEAFNMPKWINYGKVRASYANVGNDIPTRITNPTGSVKYNGTINANTTTPFGELKPEISSSIEVGTEWRFFDERLNVDFTWYQTNTTNQLFSLAAPEGSGYTSYYVNAGNIQNRGVEIILGATPVMTKNTIWKTQFNMSANRNKIIKLHDEIKQFVLTDSASDAYRMWLTEGGSYGDMYGYTFKRDESGNIEYDESGLPIKNNEWTYVGNATPKFMIGWNNTIDIYDFSIGILIDSRIGGSAMSLTQADLDMYGVSETSAKARDLGYVELEGKKITDVNGFYRRVGNRDGISSYYVYDATNIRLRELTIGYSLPKKIMDKSKAFKDVSFAFVARNLFVFYSAAPYDTDASMSASNGVQGVDYYSVPATRSFGLNIKLAF